MTLFNDTLFVHYFFFIWQHRTQLLQYSKINCHGPSHLNAIWFFNNSTLTTVIFNQIKIQNQNMLSLDRFGYAHFKN